MRYRLLLLDIDGTLRPQGQPCVPEANVAAVTAVQRAGVAVAVATGRGRASVAAALLNGLVPDYWLCAAGAQVEDAAGHALRNTTMDAAGVQAVTEFCAARGYPVRFTFTDGSYAYVGYDVFAAQERRLNHGIGLKDGSRRDRHLGGELPFSAYGPIPRGAAAEFAVLYPEIELRFVYEGGAALGASGEAVSCDILPAGVDKADGLRALCAALGIGPEQSVAIGDSDNDIGLLRAAGLGVCVAGGSEGALGAADRICPPAAQNGVAIACRRVWPEVFR